MVGKSLFHSSADEGTLCPEAPKTCRPAYGQNMFPQTMSQGSAEQDTGKDGCLTSVQAKKTQLLLLSKTGGLGAIGGTQVCALPLSLC